MLDNPDFLVNPSKTDLGFGGMANSCFRRLFCCRFASQVTECCSAKALDWLRRVAIGNEPLVSKAAAAAERSRHCLEAARKVLFSPSSR